MYPDLRKNKMIDLIQFNIISDNHVYINAANYLHNTTKNINKLTL